MLAVVLSHLLQKSGGGVRTIGVMASPLRAWGKARLEHTRKWERESGRDYWWAAENKSCERVVFQHALWDEWAEATGAQTSTVLFDIIKFSDQIPHEILLQEAVATSYPLGVLKVCLQICDATRLSVKEGRVAETDLRPRRSILAGCVVAVSLAKCLLTGTFDKVTGLWSGVRLRRVVDDVSIQCLASPRKKLSVATKVALPLAQGFAKLKLPLSEKNNDLGANPLSEEGVAKDVGQKRGQV